jgi:hypothetical protein
MAGSDAGLRAVLGPDAELVEAPELVKEEHSSKRSLLSRLRAEWHQHLDSSQQAILLSWTAFTTTFVGLRALTHWIRDGHGPSGGGMSVGGQHFHHYNIGIALLTAVGAVGLRGAEKHQRHPATAVAYGSATALIVDELALLLDLKDVYWANDGRKSVDAAVIIIALGGVLVAGQPFWPHARHALAAR